jgi:hypothetical protein
MECTLGICFKDFALIATDQTNARSILVMKEGPEQFICCLFGENAAHV